jgi:large subunit ribosomal protein L30
MEALGIRKLNGSVVKEVTPQIMGMVAKVMHLINVEEV